MTTNDAIALLAIVAAVVGAYFVVTNWSKIVAKVKGGK